MKCPHGTPAGDVCMGCGGGLARVCLECSRIGGRCWRHPAAVVVPPYTFRPFEAIDSTVRPIVISPEGEAAGLAAVPAGILSGMSWAAPPAVTPLSMHAFKPND